MPMRRKVPRHGLSPDDCWSKQFFYYDIGEVDKKDDPGQYPPPNNA